MARLKEWLGLASDRSVAVRAALTALVVGSALTLVSRWDLIAAGRLDVAFSLQIGLYFAVPYLVSSFSSVTAMRQQLAIDQHSLPLLQRQMDAINRFPDQNTNPVMRIGSDGTLLYANRTSEPIVRALGITVGQPVPADALAELRAAAASTPPSAIEVRSGVQTFSVLAVPVPDFDFMNVYGTDITAAKVVAKFPDLNTNPVLRMSPDGRLLYANAASDYIVRALGVAVGEPLAPEMADRIRQSQAGALEEPIEVQCEGRVYSLKAVLIEEFGFTNIYGTDITAARAVERLNAENERLLLNILPASIAIRLRDGEAVIADRFDELTVLFADCVGFTAMSSQLPPAELVDKLNRLFSVFDGLAEKYELEKIKTIGDAYMVAGGLLPGGDHPERVASMGLEMLREVERMKTTDFPGIEVRIGMHVGPAVAGVIGLKKFIYDVWGDTVNLASRMETMGVPGRLHVTDSTRRRLEHAFEFEARGLIEVKGIGPTQTFFVTAKRP